MAALSSASPECDETVLFEGKGAGKVTFDAAVHTSLGFSCADCHEARGLSPAIFAMKRGEDAVTMRRMELGYSCGNCHNGEKAFSASDPFSCDRCHHK
jgi:c(7)-type cytochrome triheme protein